MFSALLVKFRQIHNIYTSLQGKVFKMDLLTWGCMGCVGVIEEGQKEKGYGLECHFTQYYCTHKNVYLLLWRFLK